MSRLIVRLLGEPSMEFDGKPWRLPTPWRCVPLLALLALRRKDPPMRGPLAASMWPDELDADARANLRRHVHLLQQGLPKIAGIDWIAATPRTVAWNPEAPAWFDVADFEEFAADPLRREDAIELYRGDLLQGTYDEFLLADRERLRATYVDACFEAANDARRDRRFREAIELADRILTMDEWREDALRLAMSLHYDAGDRASALTQFERFAKRLSTEMGVAPMPETLALRDALLANAPVSGSAAPPRDLPETPAARDRMPFVGREAERASLEAAWRHAAGGRGTTVIVSGMPGIGKSRLVAEFAATVAAQGGRTLLGETSHPQAYPYEPFVDALRRGLSFVVDAPPGEAWLGALAGLLPELRAAFPDLHPVESVQTEQAQSRLFEAIARTIERLARARPLLLVLEDVHWAQQATLQALEAIALRVGGAPALLVVTHRSGEVTPDLAALRRRLLTQRLATAMELHSLDNAGIAELVRKSEDLSGVESGLAESVYARSEGNPLFAGMLLRTYRETGALPAPGVAPPSLAQTIAARVERLDPAVRTVLQSAAVIGRAFGVDVLASVLGWNENEVLDAIGTLLDRGFVRTSGSSAFSFAFTHWLVEASVYGEIAPEERAARHRRTATVLAATFGDRRDSLVSIARHWQLAGDRRRAAEAYLAGARAALDVYARGEAIELSREALTLADDARERFDALRVVVAAEEHYAPPPQWDADLTELERCADSLADEERYEALEARARYFAQTGDRDEERRSIDRMLQLARHLHSDRRIADSLDGLGNVFVGLGDFHAAAEQFRAGLVLAERLGDRRRVSRMRQQLVTMLMRCGKIAEAARQLQVLRDGLTGDETPQERLDFLWAESALGMASEDPELVGRVGREMLELGMQLEDLETQAKARWLLGWSATIFGDAAALRREYTQAAALFERLEQPQSLAATYVNLGVHYFEIGSFERAIEYYELGVRYAEQADARYVLAFAVGDIADAQRLLGDLPAARESALRAILIAEPTGDQRCLASAIGILGTVECDAGNFADGIARLREAAELRRRMGNSDSLMEDLCRLTGALVRAGDRAGAAAATAELETLVRKNAPTQRTPVHLYVTLATASRFLGNAQRGDEFEAQARRIFDAQLAALPDEESRKAFVALAHHSGLGSSVADAV